MRQAVRRAALGTAALAALALVLTARSDSPTELHAELYEVVPPSCRSSAALSRCHSVAVSCLGILFAVYIVISERCCVYMMSES